jgi:hypothetical protein
MIRTFIQRIRGLDRNLLLFLAGIALLGASGGIMESTFNNYVAHKEFFNLDADARGWLEFPRELPGFLTALFAGLLFFLPETRIAGFSALAIGAGLLGLAWTETSWTFLLIHTTVWSIGAHLIMPVRSSLTMDLADREKKGRRLGQVASTTMAASIAGFAIVWISMKWFSANYRVVFILGALIAFAAAFFLFAMRMPNAHLQRPRFVWQRRYWLYYVLSLLFGARKQIFITFGPWVLIRLYDQSAWIFAQLGIAAAVCGVFFQPWLGKAIDHWGERRVLLADSVLLLFICLGYGYAKHFDNQTLALWLLYGCYVGDCLLFGVNMARDTYLSKILVRPEHLGPTLSLGVTINHAVSMTIPAIGGLIWMRYGHPSVFAAAAVIAVLMCLFSSMVKLPAKV